MSRPSRYFWNNKELLSVKYITLKFKKREEYLILFNFRFVIDGIN